MNVELWSDPWCLHVQIYEMNNTNAPYDKHWKVNLNFYSDKLFQKWSV